MIFSLVVTAIVVVVVVSAGFLFVVFVSVPFIYVVFVVILVAVSDPVGFSLPVIFTIR